MLVLISAGHPVGAQQVQKVQKKLIETGFDKPNTERLRENLTEMEKTPFDGVMVKVNGEDGKGHSVSTRYTFTSEPWKESWFAQSIADLQAVHSKAKTFTDNFVNVGVRPGVDWFDDAGWKQVVEGKKNSAKKPNAFDAWGQYD